MDLFDIFGITEEELKDEKKASAKPKKKKKKHIQIVKDEYDIRDIDDVRIKRILKD